jgi:peptide deformylase
MAVRDIVKLPDPILKTVSAPVPAVTEEVRALVADMFDTMYAAPGIGLAAVQVAVRKRIVVTDVAKDEEPKAPMCFINPEIVWRSEETTEYEEGCLSIPEVYDKVVRPAEVRVRYMDLEGEEKAAHCTGLLATCIQHEIDHVNGVLFIDHLGRLKRDRIVKKFIKAAKLDKEEV